MGCINSKTETVKIVKAPTVGKSELNVVRPEVSAWDDTSSPQKASPVKSELKSPFLSPVSHNSSYASANKNSARNRLDESE
jgi:hypothetical protein